MPLKNGFDSFTRLCNIIRYLSSCEESDQAKVAYPAFPDLAAHISQLFIDDRLFDIMPRLELQLDLVKKYSPQVRPALDPYISTQIGVFSKDYNDYETGHFLDYPDCCIRSFNERVRYALDDLHDEELSDLNKKGGLQPFFVTISGFVPCSVSCPEAHRRHLIAFVDAAQVTLMRVLEGEIARALPHFHSEYQGKYYEIRKVRSD